MTNSNYWWQADKSKIHEDVFSHVSHLNQFQSYRNLDNLAYIRLFENLDITGLDAFNYTRVENNMTVRHRVTLNVIQSMCETVTSKITKNKPKPKFLTSGGDFSMQQRAKRLNRFIEGQFNNMGIYEAASQAFLDSTIFGTGAVKFYIHDGEVKCERVFIDEIIIDDAEAIYGKPRQMHQRKYIHKDVLKARFPKFKKEIDEARTDTNTYSPGSRQHDMVQVVESWHLPSGPKAKDGLHSITISNATLFSEPYEKSTFPFVFMRWTLRPLGFYGQGLAEQLRGIQLEINKILRTIQISMHLTSIPKVFVDSTSKVVTGHLNNEIGGIIKYTGNKPSFESVGAIPSELFSHLDRLYQRAYEISGISQLSAQSAKPAGLDSGKALREFNDIETERFMSVARRYEQFFLDSAELIITLMRDLVAMGNEAAVKIKGKDFVDKINWKDVDIDDDKFVIDVFPTSGLSSTPAGRLQEVQELLAAGLIGREDGMKLLQLPDLENLMNLENASITNIEKMVEKMIMEGEYQPPEPFQNLQLLIKKTQEAYLFYKNEGAPEDRLELLRRYMNDAQTLIDRSQAAVQAEQQLQAMGGVAPQAPGVPTGPELPPEVEGEMDVLPEGTGE